MSEVLVTTLEKNSQDRFVTLLPSVNSLLALEAVDRLGAATARVDELALTPAGADQAISIRDYLRGLARESVIQARADTLMAGPDTVADLLDLLPRRLESRPGAWEDWFARCRGGMWTSRAPIIRSGRICAAAAALWPS